MGVADGQYYCRRSFAGLLFTITIITLLLFVCDFSELLSSVQKLRSQWQLGNSLVFLQHTQGQGSKQPSLIANWTFPGVTWCSSEGDDALCPWCNKTFTRQYPLSEGEHFQRSYTPGGPCSMPPGLLQKLSSGKPVKLTVVGGSMTAGHFCNDKGRHLADCAWPARMRDRLLQVFPKANLTIKNMAKAGYTYTSYMSTGGVRDTVDADVLLIDLQVNSQVYSDSFKEMEETDEFIHQVLSLAYEQQKHLGILFVESFRVCSVQIEDCNKHCPAHRQAHMFYNHTGKLTRYSWCNKWWTIASTERPVVRHYKLPIASYRDAVWPDIAAPSPILPCFWNALSHADATNHHMVADVVTYAFLRAIGADLSGQSSHCDSNLGLGRSSSCGGSSSSSGSSSDQACKQLQPPVRFHQQLQPRQYCSVPKPGAAGAFMTAEQPASFQPVVHTGCWKFFEDRPGKPGWICEEVPRKLGGSVAANSSQGSSSSTKANGTPAHPSGSGAAAASTVPTGKTATGTPANAAATPKGAVQQAKEKARAPAAAQHNQAAAVKAAGTAATGTSSSRLSQGGAAATDKTDKTQVVGKAAAAAAATSPAAKSASAHPPGAKGAANTSVVTPTAQPASQSQGNATHSGKPGELKLNATSRLLLTTEMEALLGRRNISSNSTANASAISSSSSSSSIYFKVSFSGAPQLQLTYLTSYANMGVAEVTLYPGSITPQQDAPIQPLATYLIDTRIKDRFSIPRTSVFVHPNFWRQWQHHPNAQQLPASVKQGDYLLGLRLAPDNSTSPSTQKLKLVALSSC